MCRHCFATHRPYLLILAGMLVAVVLFLLSPLANAAEAVATRGADQVRFFDGACSDPRVTRLLGQQAEQFGAADAVIEGRYFSACWTVSGQRLLLVFEDGDQGFVPIREVRGYRSSDV